MAGTWLRGLTTGAAAGAAGTTALNAITYLDMAVRGRPTSSTPEATVEKLADKADMRIPGDDESRQNRVEGIAPLTGILAGVGTGALVGLIRSLGFKPALAISAGVAAAGALVGANGPMTALGITDPREWGAKDWMADLIPHLGYGYVTAWVLEATDPQHR